MYCPKCGLDMKDANSCLCGHFVSTKKNNPVNHSCAIDGCPKAGLRSPGLRGEGP